MAETSDSKSRDQLWLVPHEGTSRRGPVADVALTIRTRKIYSYAVPPDLADRVRPGCAVRVPYGRSGRIVEGWCLSISERLWTTTLRPISEVLDGSAPLSDRLIELARWVAEYYACPPGRVMQRIIPAAARKRPPRLVRFVRRSGTDDGRRLTAGQQALLDTVADREIAWPALRRSTGVGLSTLRTLERRGLVEVRQRPASDDTLADAPAQTSQPTPEDDYALTGAQAGALEAIHKMTSTANMFAVGVLFGVPGSGKTEVYVRAIRRVVADQRQAILLVPEIALATQIVQRLARRFKRVEVLHSRLNDSTRAAAFQRIAAGRAQVVIGTRTAVFAPCARLGLIVVDEEQETSFKSLAAPFYHARDVAIKRAQIERIPVVLGSATPSLETWYNVRRLDHYHLLPLPERVPGAVPPQVKLVANDRRRLGDEGALSEPLRFELCECVARGEQAILLHNRRGYALHLRCRACHLPISCPRCDTPLVYHRDAECLRCHHCGHTAEPPRVCLDSTCGGPIELIGTGIQRLEREITRLVPKARILRLDSDTMKRREDYAKALAAFASHDADILLGTQMIAKGLDFPAVRLVGVIDADAAFGLPDFRAAERAFQLLVQVVGRAGRRNDTSLAILQAEQVALPALQHAIRMDYEAFAAAELPVRAELAYPPVFHMTRIICADLNAGRARRAAAELACNLRRLAGRVDSGIRVDPAEDCLIFRRRNRARCQVLIRSPRGSAITHLLRLAEDERLLSPRVERVTIDVDPVDMM